MRRLAMVAAMVVMGGQAAQARECVDMGGGSYQCDDGSFGDNRGGSLYLEKHDDGGEQSPMRNPNCYRSGDRLVCD